MRGHLGPAKAADGQNGDAFALGRIGQGVQLVGNVQGDADQGVGQIGLGPDLFQPAQRGRGEPGAQSLIGGVLGFGQQRCRRRPGRAGVAVSRR